MAILIHVAQNSTRKWMLVLRRRLEKAFSMPVYFQCHKEHSQHANIIDTMLMLENILFRTSSCGGCSLQKEALISSNIETQDITHHINLTGSADIQGLIPLFDNKSSELDLFGALLDGRQPLLTIQNEGNILAAGLPSFENARSFGQTLDTVYAILVSLFIKAINRHPVIIHNRVAQVTPLAPSLFQKALRYTSHHVSFMAARYLYKLCYYAPHWHIGWRVHDGDGVWETHSLKGAPWNILPDDGLRFYADPFVLEWEGKTALFVEELPHRTGKGFISAVQFENGKPSGIPQPVLEEPWHLSYPFLFEDKGILYMIPESSSRRAVLLYKCISFPDRWEQCAVLLPDICASDATIVRHNDLYWLFCTTPAGYDDTCPAGDITMASSYSDNLSLFYADALEGPWQPHQLNPVLIDASQARPAGHFYRKENQLFRPAQDCTRGYGTGITLCSITDLDRETYSQTPLVTLRPTQEWLGKRLHTLNRCGPLEVIDGSHHNPKMTSFLR